ncbi:MAG TPA: hypothetical protein VF707_01595 [Ardenticatenaceae bacterium]|jgi:hypothetical protein
MGVKRHGTGAIIRALAGLAALQFALPKLLPLPGVSAQWLLFFLGGGVPGIIATLLGGLLLAAWGAALVPSGLSASRLALLSATAAILSRLVGLATASFLGAGIHWWPGEEPGTGAILGLLVAALLYGGIAYYVARMMELARANHAPRTGNTSSNSL